MEGTNGIETARILRRTDPDLLLVFVTSSPEYVWDAFPVHPFDYLLKPYREEKLFQLADELPHAVVDLDKAREILGVVRVAESRDVHGDKIDDLLRV